VVHEQGEVVNRVFSTAKISRQTRTIRVGRFDTFENTYVDLTKQMGTGRIRPWTS